MDSLYRILTLIKKEFLAILKDPRSRFILIGPVFIQTFLFGYAATYDLDRAALAVYDEDRSDASRKFLALVEGSGTFRRVVNANGPREIERLIDAQKALLAVHIGADFERRLLLGQSADIQVVVDGRNSNTAGTALGYFGTLAENFNAQWNNTHGGVTPPIQPIFRAWYNPNFETRRSMIPGLIGMLTLVQMIILTAMSVAREREQGTFDQLLVSPFHPTEIIVGKSVPSVLVGLVQAGIVLCIALFWFKIPFQGSIPLLYAGILLFLLAAVGLGLMISSIVATMQQALLGGFLLIMPFSLLSGLNTPITNMPPAMQTATLINPLRHAVSLVHHVFLEGAPLEVIASDLRPLAIIAAVSLSVAVWMFRRRRN